MSLLSRRFDQFNASLLNTNMNFFKNKLLFPNFEMVLYIILVKFYYFSYFGQILI